MKDLHLADSVKNLNELAQKNFKKVKPDKLYSTAGKVFKSALHKYHQGDEESAYVLYQRFILIYEFLESKSDDKQYTSLRLGSEYKTVINEIEKLKLSLNNRYLEVELRKNLIQVKWTDESKTEVKTPVTPVITFTGGFITCNELYNLLQKKKDIIIFDSRCKNDYEKSHMKHPETINIAEEIIQSGKSANILEKEIPNDNKTLWHRRWKSELVVLLDWASQKETVTASKVSILKEILVQWDTTVKENKQPVILSGGYLEWLQTYPMLCINPDILYAVQNDVLNDLLDLDSIEYPTAEEATRYLKPPSLQPVINRATKPTYQPSIQLPDNDLAAIFDNKEIDLKQIDYCGEDEQELRNEYIEFEESIRDIPQPQRDLKPEDKNGEKKYKPDVNKENEEIRKKLQHMGIGDAKVPFNNISNLTEEILPKKNDTREKLLQEAREKKKNLSLDSYGPSSEIKKNSEIFPVVDRNSKPITAPIKYLFTPGYTGLKNLGVTCYMNSVLQVYSNTRALHHFFLVDANSNSIVKGNFSRAFRDLLAALWNGQFKTFSPSVFKKMFNEYEPRFRSREHQDAEEFLCSLNSWLHDDLKNDIERPLQCVWTPKEEAWIEETNGKISIIHNTFMGQQSTMIDCENCQNKLRKFETFQTLPLALPARDSTLQECLQLYTKRQKIDGYTCNKCISSERVFISHHFASLPPNLIITLKRFQMNKDREGYISFGKNTVEVNYPIENLNIAGITYHLYAIIVHRGGLDMGHYFAVVRNVRNATWLVYDDSNVYPADLDALIEINDAYMLFYNTEDEEMKTKKQFRR